MLLSLNWLREFTPYEGGAEELGERLTMLGLELEEVKRPFAGLKDLVVGKVVECGRHPQADKLSLCRVDVGAEILPIVCGAPNVAKDQYVAVAPVGAVLPGGLAIKKAKLRGEESHGMICSERELGLSDDHSGIMILQDLVEGPFTPGARLLDALKLDEEVLDVSITPNRADCLSVLGLARETALAFNLPLSLPEVEIIESGPAAESLFKVELPEPDLCPTYFLRMLQGAKIARSPARMRWRLVACGLRPISNAVDATNYVLLELGQPLHAFDADKTEGGLVIVRGADEGEKTVSLDGREHTLNKADITIRDAKKTIGLGGVMGGANSEITEESRNILLESAVFNPSAIRRTAKRLGIPSDASYRFERGVDSGLTRFALDRASALIARNAGATILPGCLGAALRPWTAPRVTLRKQKCDDLIGLPMEESFCKNTLEKLGCKLEYAPAWENALVWSVTPPSHRLDLTREADLIEEIARVYGVDKIPAALPKVLRPLDRAGRPESRFGFLNRVKRMVADLGLMEAINYSFVGHKDLDQLGLPEENRISVKNPLSADQDVLRSAIAPGLLANLRHNLSQGNTSLRLFEVANAFFADPQSETTAREELRLGLLLHGERLAPGWPNASPATAQDADYLDLKGVIEQLLIKLGLGPAAFSLSPSPQAWLHPQVDIILDGRKLGFAGLVRAKIADAFHARKEVWMAELDMALLQDLHAKAKVRFAPLPVFPPVRRDITVRAPLALESGQIEANIRSAKTPLLEEVQLVDLFAPNAEEKNLTFRLTFRHQDRTLKDAEVDKLRDAIVKELREKLSVVI